MTAQSRGRQYDKSVSRIILLVNASKVHWLKKYGDRQKRSAQLAQVALAKLS